MYAGEFLTESFLSYSACKADLSALTFTFSPLGCKLLIAVSNAVNKLPTVEIVSSAPFSLFSTLSAFSNALSKACFLVSSAVVYLSCAEPSFGLISRAFSAKS